MERFDLTVQPEQLIYPWVIACIYICAINEVGYKCLHSSQFDIGMRCRGSTA